MKVQLVLGGISVTGYVFTLLSFITGLGYCCLCLDLELLNYSELSDTYFLLYCLEYYSVLSVNAQKFLTLLKYIKKQNN